MLFLNAVSWKNLSFKANVYTHTVQFSQVTNSQAKALHLNNSFTFFLLSIIQLFPCVTPERSPHTSLHSSCLSSPSQFISSFRIPPQLQSEIPLLLPLSVFHLHSLFPLSVQFKCNLILTSRKIIIILKYLRRLTSLLWF